MSCHDVRMTGDPSIAGLVLDSPFSDLKAGGIHLCREFQCEIIDCEDKQFLCAEKNCDERREAVLAVSARGKTEETPSVVGHGIGVYCQRFGCHIWRPYLIRIGASHPSLKHVEACGSL